MEVSSEHIYMRREDIFLEIGFQAELIKQRRKMTGIDDAGSGCRSGLCATVSNLC